MITEQEYRRLKEEYETAKSEAEQAKGALSQLTEQLKEEFDCDNLEQAEAKLKRLMAEQERIEKDFRRSLKDYETKWESHD